MSSVIISIQSSLLREPVDLELPDEMEIQHLLPELVRALQLPTGNLGQYQLIRQKRRRPLRGRETLSRAGVSTGDVLSLVSSSPVGTGPGRASSAGASALLRCPSGAMIALDNYGKTELSVGRYDARTGKSPDIELSDEPQGNTVSRSHALLRKRGNQWSITHRSAKNVTRVGNTQLAPQQAHTLKPGDVITLGRVRFVFETGSF
jgi:molybdopterin converting factor small subunit